MTAAIAPEQFPEQLSFAANRTAAAIILALLLVAGFALRVNDLGVESLGEDEFNKLQTVGDYRQNGLTSRNGEHPFLMKGLQTVSIAAAEKLAPTISEEAALRFPIALFGTFCALLLFFLFKELFSASIGLVTAALWSLEPLAISFDRVAKEDSLALFFFLLAAILWVKGQTAAETGQRNWLNWVWATAAAFGAMLASKYYVNLFTVCVSYYHSFNRVPGHKWALGKKRWLRFLIVMGVSLVILNPTLLLPDTWREMLKFSSESRVGHDSYEFLGQLYQHRFSTWLNGVPWTYYFVLAAVKSSLPVLVFFVPGFVLVFRRRLGDGRFFLFFWFLIWFVPFTLMGGKFMRYFTVSEPLLLVIAAVGFCFAAKWLTDKLPASTALRSATQLALFAALLVMPVVNSISAAPHFRLFTNSIGGGMAAAGTFFPHDEFYDAATRETVAAIAADAAPGSVVAGETPELFAHYAAKASRPDLKFVSLSDKAQVLALSEGDHIVLTSGRRYFSNDAYFEYFAADPGREIRLAGAVAARVFRLDPASLAGVRSIAGR